MKENPLYKLAELSSNHIRNTEFEADTDSGLAISFANDLDSVPLNELPEQTSEKKSVRGLKYSSEVLDSSVPGYLLELKQAAHNAFDYVQWTEFYEEDAWSKSFLNGFANGEGIGPDGKLYHSDISHSIRTSDIPFFAIFGWRGEINARSWYRNTMANLREPKKYPKIMKS